MIYFTFVMLFSVKFASSTIDLRLSTDNRILYLYDTSTNGYSWNSAQKKCENLGGLMIIWDDMIIHDYVFIPMIQDWTWTGLNDDHGCLAIRGQETSYYGCINNRKNLLCQIKKENITVEILKRKIGEALTINAKFILFQLEQMEKFEEINQHMNILDQSQNNSLNQIYGLVNALDQTRNESFDQLYALDETQRRVNNSLINLIEKTNVKITNLTLYNSKIITGINNKITDNEQSVTSLRKHILILMILLLFGFVIVKFGSKYYLVTHGFYDQFSYRNLMKKQDQETQNFAMNSTTEQNC